MKRTKYVAACRQCEEIVECELVNAGHWIVELLLYGAGILGAVVLPVYVGILGVAVIVLPFVYSHHRVRRRRPRCKQCQGMDVVPAESTAGARMANPSGLPVPR